MTGVSWKFVLGVVATVVLCWAAANLGVRERVTMESIPLSLGCLAAGAGLVHLWRAANASGDAAADAVWAGAVCVLAGTTLVAAGSWAPAVALGVCVAARWFRRPAASV